MSQAVPLLGLVLSLLNLLMSPHPASASSVPPGDYTFTYRSLSCGGTGTGYYTDNLAYFGPNGGVPITGFLGTHYTNNVGNPTTQTFQTPIRNLTLTYGYTQTRLVMANGAIIPSAPFQITRNAAVGAGRRISYVSICCNASVGSSFSYISQIFIYDDQEHSAYTGWTGCVYSPEGGTNAPTANSLLASASINYGIGGAGSLQFAWATPRDRPPPPPPPPASKSRPPPPPPPPPPRSPPFKGVIHPPRPPSPPPPNPRPPPRPPPPRSQKSPPPSPPPPPFIPTLPLPVTLKSDYAKIVANIPRIPNRVPASTIVMLGQGFPVVQDKFKQALIASLRYSQGRLSAFGGEGMITGCCKKPNPDSSRRLALATANNDTAVDKDSYEDDEGDDSYDDEEEYVSDAEFSTTASTSAAATAAGDNQANLDRLILLQAKWAVAGTSDLGRRVRVRVSHKKYVKVAKYLVKKAHKVFGGPKLYPGGYFLPPDKFADGGYLNCDLYILGSYSDSYLDLTVQQAIQKFVAYGKAVLVVGPDVLPSYNYDGIKPDKLGRRSLQQGDYDLVPELAADDIPVNEVTGPMGLVFSGDVSNPTASPLPVDATTPDILYNAEQAALAFLQFVQGLRTLSPTELSIVTTTRQAALATLTRTTPGAQQFFVYEDQSALLQSTLPPQFLPPAGKLPPVFKKPPPPPPVLSPPPPPGTLPAGVQYVGCFKDKPADHSFPILLGPAGQGDPQNSVTKCAQLAAAHASQPHFIALQQGKCFGGSSLDKAFGFGQLADASCFLNCPGNPLQKCGATTPINSVYSRS